MFLFVCFSVSIYFVPLSTVHPSVNYLLYKPQGKLGRLQKVIHGGDAAVGVQCGTDGGHDDDGDYRSYSV